MTLEDDLTVKRRRIGDQRPRLEHLPADVANTDAGDEVIEFARRFGLVLDDWQQWVVRHMCSERSDGTWAATQCVLLVPRQSGKSAILEAIEMAALFLWDEAHIIYSAHLGKTATDHMRRIRRHVQSVPEFRRQARVLTGKGDERVERDDTGAILEFITRGKKTARGGSPNRVIFDEAMFLTDEQIQAMLPSMSAQSMNVEGAPQMAYFSSAPIAESEVLHRLRKRALTAPPQRLFFAEWSVEEDADPADRSNWYRANPGLGIRISEEWIADNEFGALSEFAFGVERLGIPHEPITEVTRRKISAESWAKQIDPDSDIVSALAFGVAVAPDAHRASIAAGGLRPDGDAHVEIIVTDVGVRWLKPELRRLLSEWRPASVAIDASGPGEKELIPEIRDVCTEVGVQLVELTARAYAGACSGFVTDTVLENRLWHFDDPDLSTSVSGSYPRQVGDAWYWDRWGDLDVTPLVAATCALRACREAPEEVSEEFMGAWV